MADDDVMFRRVLSADGRSRAFVNDNAVSLAVMRAWGSFFIEIEGQFSDYSLLHASNHRVLVDSFLGLDDQLESLAGLYRDYREALLACESAQHFLAEGRDEESYYRACLEELERFRPVADEELSLLQRRRLLQAREKIQNHLQEARSVLAGFDGEEGVGARLQELRRSVHFLAETAPDTFSAILPRVSRPHLSN